MHKPPEDVLQFIWQHRLMKPGRLRAVSGAEITIVRPGELNRDAGPDFFNALIVVNGVSLAGNVEIHSRSSDWARHNHASNRAYDNLVLHAVYDNDVEIPQNTDHNVEVLELRHFIDENTLHTYADLCRSNHALPCSKQLHRVDDSRFSAEPSE